MAAAVDTSASPRWFRTGYRFFPYAAEQSGRWWVLRLNHGFPEHDLYTLFIGGEAAADLTPDAASDSRLLAGIAALTAGRPEPMPPQLDSATAQTVVGRVARYVDYGSEHGDPCNVCSTHADGMARG